MICNSSPLTTPWKEQTSPYNFHIHTRPSISLPGTRLRETSATEASAGRKNRRRFFLEDLLLYVCVRSHVFASEIHSGHPPATGPTSKFPLALLSPPRRRIGPTGPSRTSWRASPYSGDPGDPRESCPRGSPLRNCPFFPGPDRSAPPPSLRSCCSPLQAGGPTPSDMHPTCGSPPLTSDLRALVIDLQGGSDGHPPKNATSSLITSISTHWWWHTPRSLT